MLLLIFFASSRRCGAELGPSTEYDFLLDSIPARSTMDSLPVSLAFIVKYEVEDPDSGRHSPSAFHSVAGGGSY